MESMSKIAVIISLFLCMLGIQGCFKEEVIYNAEPDGNYELPLILRMNGKNCVFDNDLNMLRYSLSDPQSTSFEPYVEFQSYSSVTFENMALINKQVNQLGTIELYKRYNVAIKTNNTVRNLTLVFTSFPIVQVITPNTILDEPKTLAKIHVNYPEYSEPTFSTFIGIEYRGATSQGLPKKSYGFSCVRTKYIDDEYSAPFFGLEKNRDWILDAMYHDHARQRGRSSFEIWRTMDGNNHYGTNSNFVELYINNRHQGIYCFNETINAELIGLTDPNALLYKATTWGDGATEFYTYSGETPFLNYWDGWIQKYPLLDGSPNWEPLRHLRWLIVQSNSQDFVDGISQNVDLENIIDYHLFLNLIFASDNTGKNTYLMRQHDTDPFKIIPWDLDGTWGLFWNGNSIGYNEVLSNGLYNRLLALNPNDFRMKMKTRWIYLRANTFSQTNLTNVFEENFEQLSESDIISIENAKWNQGIDLETEHVKLNNWLTSRLIFLDEYYANL